MNEDLFGRNDYLRSLKPELTKPKLIKQEIKSNVSATVLPIRQVRDEVKARPLANEPLVSPIVHPFGRMTDVDYNTLWAYVYSSPEMQALLDALTNDILSDGYFLEGGRNNIKKAEKFLQDNQFKQMFKSCLWDAFVTGNFYIYKAKIKEEQVKKVIWNVMRKANLLEHKSFETHQLEVNQMLEEVKALDEDMFTARKIQYVASSTMRANFDEHGDVNEYIQVVAGRQPSSKFTPEEIIHFKLMDLNGKFYGHTPMVAATPLIDLLTDIRDYARYFFEKGGDPPRLYILKDCAPGDPTYKAFEKTVQQYAMVTNKFKSMVITGDVEVQDISRLTKDMEFRQLAVYVTQVMIMLWGVPPSRVPNIIMENSAKQDISTTDGYDRKISHIQDILEDLLNSQLLDEFHVKLKFNRNYKTNEVREVQIDLFRADVVDKLYSKGIVNKEWIWRYLKIEDQYRGDMKPKQSAENTNRQNQLPNQQLMQSEDRQTDNRIKQSMNIQRKALEKKGLSQKEIEAHMRKEYFYMDRYS